MRRHVPDPDLATDLREAIAVQRRKVNEIDLFLATYDAQLAALYQTIHDVTARSITAPEEKASAREHLVKLERRLKDLEEKDRSKRSPRPQIVAKVSPMDALLKRLASGDTSVIPEIQRLAQGAS